MTNVTNIDEFYVVNQTYKCLLCSNSPIFYNLKEGTHHLDVQHSKESDPNLLLVFTSHFECKFCTKDLTCRNNMIGHMKRKHNLSVSPGNVWSPRFANESLKSPW